MPDDPTNSNLTNSESDASADSASDPREPAAAASAHDASDPGERAEIVSTGGTETSLSWRSRLVVFAIIVVVGTAVDLWSKAAAFEAMDIDDETIVLAVQADPERPTAKLGQTTRLEFWPDHFYFSAVLNPGAFGGLFGGQKGLLIGLAVFAVIVVVAVLLSAPHVGNFQVWLAGAIIAGALGNLYDRVRFGAVRDFMDFSWPESGIGFMNPWNTFNVADALISCSIVVFLFSEIFRRPPPKPVKDPEADADAHATSAVEEVGAARDAGASDETPEVERSDRESPVERAASQPAPGRDSGDDHEPAELAVRESDSAQVSREADGAS